MRVKCEECFLIYDDAVRLTYCPHDKFMSDESLKQKDLGLSLIGKDLWFAHMQEGTKHRVQGVGHNGMVTISGMAGEFAPHLFVVVP